jgi:hypothetical protein
MTLVEPDGVTVTVMTFAPLLLPQPLSGPKQAASNKIPRYRNLPRNFVLTISPTLARSADPPPARDLTLFSETLMRDSR